MDYSIFIQLAIIPITGIAATWLAWRLRIPSILVLILTGFFLGPVLGILNPDSLFGNKLYPMVSLAVAVILFEGGLSLHLSELTRTGKVVRNLITIGVIITWILNAGAAFFVLNLPIRIAILLGAILTVTGPTVIFPIVKNLHLKRHIASILRWESMMLDPITAILGILSIQFLFFIKPIDFFTVGSVIILKTLVFGAFFGCTGALILIYILHKHWVPDSLQEVVTLMFVLCVYLISNILQAESGHLTVTLMGIVLANQKRVSIKNILSFKEKLAVLILSSLFVILSARIEIGLLVYHFHWRMLLFILFIIFISRPISVMISTLNSEIPMIHRIFLSFMAPRGIVAASISSLFAIRLNLLGIPNADDLVSMTFTVIIITVVFYSLCSLILLKPLQVAQPKQYGVVFVGADEWVRKIAMFVHNSGIAVLLVDTDESNVISARAQGLSAIHGSILSQTVLRYIETKSFGRLLAMTQNDEINILACITYQNLFGHRSIYALNPTGHKLALHSDFEGRILFGATYDYSFLKSRIQAGAKIMSFTINAPDDLFRLQRTYPDLIVLMAVFIDKTILIQTQAHSLQIQTSHTLIVIA